LLAASSSGAVSCGALDRDAVSASLLALVMGATLPAAHSIGVYPCPSGGNTGAGSYQRKLATKTGEVMLTVPRLRKLPHRGAGSARPVKSPLAGRPVKCRPPGLAEPTPCFQDVLERFQDVLERFQDVLEWLQDGLERLQDGLERLQDGLERLQDVTERLQDVTERLQDVTERLQDGLERWRDGLVQCWGALVQRPW